MSGILPVSLRAVSSPIAATAPLVQRDLITFHLPDPGAELAGVRLATDRGFPLQAAPFVREGDGWTLRMPAPALARFEYAFAVQRGDDGVEHWTDPANPLRAPGAFGEKSVVALPGYEEPAMSHASQPELAARFSLVLTCAKNTLFCNSQHRGVPALR